MPLKSLHYSNDFAAKNLAVVFLYSVAWWASFEISTNFEIIANLSAWFLPAGIRAAAFLFLPKRYWVSIFFSESIIHVFQTMMDTGYVYLSTADTLKNIAVLADQLSFRSLLLICWAIIPVACYAIPCHLFLGRHHSVDFKSFRNIAALFGAMAVAALANGLNQIATRLFLNFYDGQDYTLSILSFFLGDLIGVFVVVPLVYLFINGRSGIDIKAVPSLRMFVSVLVIVVLGVLSTLWSDSFGYYFNLIAFITIIFLAFQFPWLGASVALLVINFLTLFTIYLDWELFDILNVQVYVIGFAVAGIMLSTTVNKLRRSNKELTDQSIELSLKNEALSKQFKANQTLAQKLVDMQEQERKKIADQLHDDFGQNITSLKLQLKAIESSPAAKELSSAVKSIKLVAENMHNSTYELLHALRPAPIEKLGLYEALSERRFSQIYPESNVSYQADINPKVNDLSETQQTLVYRIVFECITNTLKHAKASCIKLRIDCHKSQYYFCIEDDGEGFDQNMKRSGYGLVGIEEKVIALNAVYTLESSSNGTKHILYFNLQKDSE